MIETNNLTNFAIDKKSFSQVAKKVLSGENRIRESISLAFVSKAGIKKLNKKFRKKDKPTDVLSFRLNEKGYLGEVIICPEVVKKNAKKYKSDFKKELIRVFVHGVLHLCKYEHEKSEKSAKIMGKKEKIYLSNNT